MKRANSKAQSDFFATDPELKPSRLSHGGGKAKGTRKLSRPLDRKRPLHITLKSSCAREKLSLLNAKNRLFVERTIRDYAKIYGVKIRGFENMGNHVHAVVIFSKREAFQNFLRTVTALIARFVTGARRGKPFGKRFWDTLAFTRVITSYRDILAMENYLTKNSVERSFGNGARKAVEKSEDIFKRLRKEAMKSG